LYVLLRCTGYVLFLLSCVLWTYNTLVKGKKT
jgi:hypothetical protein